jgi:hypothetical protein
LGSEVEEIFNVDRRDDLDEGVTDFEEIGKFHEFVIMVTLCKGSKMMDCGDML